MSKNQSNLEAIKKAIELAGGMSELSIKANVGYQAILDWNKGRKSPSPLSCKKIEKATDGEVKAEDILPDFPWHTLK